MKWMVALALPLLYAAAVVWALRPAPPVYVTPDKTVVTVKERPGPAALHAPEIVYPAAALRDRVEGTVKLRVKIDGGGRVAQVSVVSGPAVLAQAAVGEVRQWQYAAEAAEAEVSVVYSLARPGPRSWKAPEPLTRVAVSKAPAGRGIVRLVAMVDPAGRVEFVQPVSGPAGLRAAAVQAVRQWRFLPALRDGAPDHGTAVVEVQF